MVILVLDLTLPNIDIDMLFYIDGSGVVVLIEMPRDIWGRSGRITVEVLGLLVITKYDVRERW